MIIAGVIAEFNPFHNGHAYQLSRIRTLTGADYCIAAMSGDFVQRGTPAVLDKYTRTKMALQAGYDLVAELPCAFAAASAEVFAAGGVMLLSACGITHLCFGAECTSLPLLQKIAQLLTPETEDFRRELALLLRQGLSYPAARARALIACLPEGTDADAINEVLQKPNNILAIEYLKAIERYAPHIIPVLIPRIGSGYHDTTAEGSLASATGIRGQLLQKTAVSDLSSFIPAASLSILQDAVNQGRVLPENSIDGALGFALLQLKAEETQDEFLLRAIALRHEYTGFLPFCDLLKTRNITLTAVRRRLLHLLLPTPDLSQPGIRLQVPYIRILGFRRLSSPLLALIKERKRLPLITRPIDGENILEEFHASVREDKSFAIDCFQGDIFAADFYNQLVSQQGGKPVRRDYAEPLVLI